jgi:HEAT repeat protein
VSDARPEVIVDRLCAGEFDTSMAGEAANELLNYMLQGASIELIRRLVRCDEEQAVTAGAWIISELGEGAAVLLYEVRRLLDSPFRNARFFAIDAILSVASEDDGLLISKAISLLGDGDEAVRWKVLRLLSVIDLKRLSSAVSCLTDARLKNLIEWLLGHKNDLASVPEIMTMLVADEKMVRIAAAVAAAHLSRLDTRPLERASQSSDMDIRSFAQRELNILASRSGPMDGG